MRGERCAFKLRLTEMRLTAIVFSTSPPCEACLVYGNFKDIEAVHELSRSLGSLIWHLARANGHIHAMLCNIHNPELREYWAL